MLYGKDISVYNNYSPGDEDFVIIKMSGGDAGLYYDSKATVHYNTAKGAGKVVGGYHFAGGGDPVAEADYFVGAMSPISDGDLFALDWEIQHNDPVGWCLAFVNHVHDRAGVWPFIYLNISTTNSYDWSPVLKNCGLWLAAPSIAYDANALISHTYVLQQGPIVGGIDQDVAFMSRDQLLKYGWHAAQPAPAPAPQPAPQPTPTPQPQPPAPTPPPLPSSPPPPTTPSGQGSVKLTPKSTPVKKPTPPQKSWLELLWEEIKRLFGLK